MKLCTRNFLLLLYLDKIMVCWIFQILVDAYCIYRFELFWAIFTKILYSTTQTFLISNFTVICQFMSFWKKISKYQV